MLRTGDQVGGYEVLGVLGAGGMGQVYRVRNVISDRVEAMKVMLADLETDPAVAERFLREIKVHARLSHINIASLRTAFESEGRVMMILELLEGETLAQQLERSRLPLDQVLDFCEQALSALIYSHAQGVIHRDLKPGNIFLTSDGVLKLMDFGIARAVSERTLTAKGALVGSLHYMSPEQVRGEEIDTRTDLYSLGVVLYQMATGRRPFDGNSEFTIMRAHLEEPPEPPSEVDSSVPPSLSTIILRAMRKNPDERFQTAQEFLRAVSAARSSPLAAAAPAAPLSPAPPPDDRTILDAPQPESFLEAPHDTTIRGGAPRLPQPWPVETPTRAATAPPKREAPPNCEAPVPHRPEPEPTPAAAFRVPLWMVGAALAILLIAVAATLLPRWFSPDPEDRPPEAAPAITFAESTARPEPVVEPIPVPSRAAAAAPKRPAPPPRRTVPELPVSTPPVSTPPADTTTAATPPATTATAQPPPEVVEPPKAEPQPPPVPAPKATAAPTPAPQPPPAPKPAPPVAKPGPDPDRVYALSEVDQPPQNVHRVQAQYTAEALKLGVEGRVRLEAEIWPDGTARNIRVAASVGDAGLDQSAIQALRQWRFAPATLEGVAVKSRILVEITFRLEGARKRPGLN